MIQGWLGMALMALSTTQPPAFQVLLEQHSNLADFPSGSAMVLQEQQLYIIGDDATHVQQLDLSHQPLDQIKLLTAPHNRLPKANKPDLEAACICLWKEPTLLAWGSGSLSPQRDQLLILPLNSQKPRWQSVGSLYSHIRQSIPELNLEGASCLKGEQILLANRGHQGSPHNQLIRLAFKASGQFSLLGHQPLELPQPAQGFIGISGLAYLPEQDWLLFCASTEHTASRYDDGKIGDSYLGLITQFSKQPLNTPLKPSWFYNLNQLSPAFQGHKIESLAPQAIGPGQWLIHLVSDNDNGETGLFKIQLKENRSYVTDRRTRSFDLFSIL